MKTEALLESLGADPTFAEAVLGDLAEEYALRAVRDGVAAARRWYAWEALRSAPHLGKSALRYMGPRGRARLVALLAGVALAVCLTLLALSSGLGPPAHLVAGNGIVNNLEPARLAMRVLDAKGRVLPDTAVRYTWSSGAPISVSPDGLVTCARQGDAVVLAALGPLITHVPVRCRPVADMDAPHMLDLILGGPAREVPFEAVGPDRRPVTLLVGRIRVDDSTIAVLEGPRIRARAPGRTWVETLIGDRAITSSVHVYGPARSPEGIGPGQHLAVRVWLARGEQREWRLPAGSYFLRVVLDQDDQPKARLAVTGGFCNLYGGTHLQCVARGHMTVTVRHSRLADPAQELRGTLLVWRLGR